MPNITARLVEKTPSMNVTKDDMTKTQDRCTQSHSVLMEKIVRGISQNNTLSI